MNRTGFGALVMVVSALGTWTGAARADSAEAMCEVRKEGETRKGASGPCTFSQRQGYINLDLRNGETYSLAPGSNANHYKDQKGHKVVRSPGASGVEEFKWEGGKKIIVTLVSSGPSQAHQKHTAAGVPSKQEQACLAAVSRKSNNGDVTVLSSEFSQANSLVMIGVGPQRAPWRCLVSNSGVVAEVFFAGSEGAL